MNMKQIALGVTIALSSSLAMATDNANVTVNSAVTSSPCVITPATKTQTVNLGSVSELFANANYTNPSGDWNSIPVTFSFDLTSCGSGSSSVSLTYTGDYVQSNNGALVNKGTAKNVAVQIFPDASKAKTESWNPNDVAKFDGTTVGRVVPLVMGDNSFSSAAVIAYWDEPIEAGTVVASATMSLTYN